MFRMSYILLPLLKSILFLPHTNFSLLISHWYVAFIVKYEKLSKGAPIQNIWANDHFQIIITIETSLKQYKILTPTWSSPSLLLITASLGSQAITGLLAMNTLASLERSHSTPHQEHLPFDGMREFLMSFPFSFCSSYCSPFPSSFLPSFIES